jgi:glycosyltransferase involved in cell wall biosynthesis
LQSSAPSSPPAISVIIPVFNGDATIGDCLAKLYASTFRDFEAIVVDDASTDRTAAIVEGFPCRLIACPKNSGQSAARNLGAAQSAGGILFFLDADILVARDSLSEIARAMAERPEISALFGSFASTTMPGNFAAVYKNLRHHYTHQTSNEEAATFCGGFGAIRREAFFAAGGFNPTQRFMEDVELGYRLHRAGHRIWLHKRLLFIHCKHYTLAKLIHADVFGRAIPWTRLMLDSRLFRSDLNTQAHNVWSLPLSYLLLAALLVPMLWLPVALPLIGVLLWLNRGFLGFTLRERGWFFAVRAALMCWLGYLYSGVGALLGLLLPRR